jgi:hypothetical protein
MGFPDGVQKPEMLQVLIMAFWFRPNSLEFGDYGSAEPKTLDEPEEERMCDESDPERDKGGRAPNGV